MTNHLRRLAQVTVSLLIVGAAAMGATPAASATTTVATFVTIDSTPVGCTGARVSSITSDVGVRYYHHGKLLHFPTKVLRFDELGFIELTARPKAGRTVTQTHGRIAAPAGCFTDLTVADEPRQGPIQSWCAGFPTPALSQVFSSGTLENQTAVWQLVRRANHKVVASGTATIYLGIGPVSFPLPVGLALGRYVLTLRNTASSAELFPYSMRAEHYRCMKPATVRTGAVVFTVPAGGPGATIEVFEDAPQVPSTVLTVRAGHRYTYRTTAKQLEYVAYPTGDHVGFLGSGFVQVPQT